MVPVPSGKLHAPRVPRRSAVRAPCCSACLCASRATADRLDKDMHALLQALQARVDTVSFAGLVRAAEAMGADLKTLRVSSPGVGLGSGLEVGA